MAYVRSKGSALYPRKASPVAPSRRHSNAPHPPRDPQLQEWIDSLPVAAAARVVLSRPELRAQAATREFLRLQRARRPGGRVRSKKRR